MDWYSHSLEHAAPWAYALLAGQVTLLSMLIERSVFLLLRGQVNVALFMAAVRKLVAAGSLERALKLTAALDAPAGRVAHAGLSGLGRGAFWLREELDRAIAAEQPPILRRLKGIPVLALLLAGLGVLGSASLGAGSPSFGADGPLPFGLAQEFAPALLGLVSCVLGLFVWLALSSKARQILNGLEQCKDGILDLDAASSNGDPSTMAGGAPERPVRGA